MCSLQVIKGAEILEVLHSLPSVRQYLFSLYECRYSVFFQSLGENVFYVVLKFYKTLSPDNFITLFQSFLYGIIHIIIYNKYN